MLDLLVDVLATHRLTVLVVEDTITEPIRNRIAQAGDNHPVAEWASDLVTCPWCASMHIGIAVALARRFAPRVWSVPARALAASSVTGLLVSHG